MFYNLPFDIADGTNNGSVVSEGYPSGRTHSFKSLIASLTGAVKLSMSLPWTPLCRLLHRCEQSFASWMKSFSFMFFSYGIPSLSSNSR